MRTLSDILTMGERAADAGAPLVKNWPQVRASLHLIDRAIGLHKIPASGLPAVLPERIEDFGDEVRRTFPSGRAYGIARREVLRVLVVVGHVEDHWEALRVLIRRAGREDLERVLWPLMSPARRAGLAPSGILRDWVWSLDAECRINAVRKLFYEAAPNSQMLRGATFGTLRKVAEAKKIHERAIIARQVLRQAVVGFDKLFEIEEIAASVLLPPERIGAPPAYDRLGRLRIPLPPRLSGIHEAAPSPRPTNLPEIWQAICASQAVDLPDDPSADDLLAPETWERIAALPTSVLGLREDAGKIYLGRARGAATARVPSRAKPRPS